MGSIAVFFEAAIAVAAVRSAKYPPKERAPLLLDLLLSLFKLLHVVHRLPGIVHDSNLL